MATVSIDRAKMLRRMSNKQLLAMHAGLPTKVTSRELQRRKLEPKKSGGVGYVTSGRNGPGPRFKQRAPVQDDRFPVSEAGVNYIEMVTNPLGEGHNDGCRGVTCGLPRADGQLSSTLCTRGVTTYTAGANGTAWIWLHGYTSTDGNDMSILYGTDATDPAANTGTTTALKYTPMCVGTTAIIGTKKILLNASGIRITLISAPEVSAGSLEAFSTKARLKSATATYVANSLIATRPIGKSWSVFQGMCARKVCTDDGMIFATPNSLNYSADGQHGEQLAIRCSGLNATTILKIEWVCHYEIASDETTPLTVVNPVPEERFESIQYFCNNVEFTASGNSFKSFIQAVGRALYDGARLIVRVSKRVGPYVLPAAGAVVGASLGGMYGGGMGGRVGGYLGSRAGAEIARLENRFYDAIDPPAYR